MDWFVWLIWILVIILVIILIWLYVRGRSRPVSGSGTAGTEGRPAAQHMASPHHGTGSPQHYVDSTSAETSGHATSADDSRDDADRGAADRGAADSSAESRYASTGNMPAGREGMVADAEPAQTPAEGNRAPLAAPGHYKTGSTEWAPDAPIPQPAQPAAPAQLPPGAAPFGPDSATPAAGGQAPAGFMIKATTGPMTYHGPDSPQYGEVAAEVWFRTYAAAEAAGFHRSGE